MKKIILISLMLCLMIASVMAVEEGIEINIDGNKIIIRGYVDSQIAGRVDAGYFQKVNETFSNSTIICDENVTQKQVNGTDGNITLINETYQTNCRVNLTYYKDIPFDINDSHTAIIGDTTLQRKYEECVEDRSGYRISYNTCINEKREMIDNGKNFSECTNQLNSCNSQKTVLSSERDNMKQQVDDKKNLWIISGIIGLIIGILGTLYHKGHIGKKIREVEEHNLQGAA